MKSWGITNVSVNHPRITMNFYTNVYASASYSMLTVTVKQNNLDLLVALKQNSIFLWVP